MGGTFRWTYQHCKVTVWLSFSQQNHSISCFFPPQNPPTTSVAFDNMDSLQEMQSFGCSEWETYSTAENLTPCTLTLKLSVQQVTYYRLKWPHAKSRLNIHIYSNKTTKTSLYHCGSQKIKSTKGESKSPLFWSIFNKLNATQRAGIVL